MSKLYYGNVFLPEIPVVDGYPYAFIRKNNSSGYYDLIYSKLRPVHDGSSNIGYMNGSSVGAGDTIWYRIEISTANTATEWTYNQTLTTWWGFDSTRFVLWTNTDIPNESDTATEIFFGAIPNNIGYIASEVTSGTTLTATIDAEAGTWILATVAVRSAFTAPEGWTILHETGTIGSNQRIILLCKQATEDGTVSFTATQATSGRIYTNLIAIQNCFGFVYHDGSEFLDTTTASVSFTRTRPNLDTIIWCMTKNYWTSGLWTCDTLPESIQLPSTTSPRLCNFIDSVPSDTRTFTAPTSEAGTIIDYVEVIFEQPSEKKYLLKSGSNLYTVTDGSFVMLTETEVTSTVFSSNGFDSLPEWSIIAGLEDPEILFWDSNAEATLPVMTATMTATPIPQVLTTDAINISHPSILGIEFVTVQYSGNPLFFISFDEGVTWKVFDGSTWIESEEGMTVDVMTAITSEQWSEAISGATSMMVRFVLTNLEDKVENVVIEFIN